MNISLEQKRAIKEIMFRLSSIDSAEDYLEWNKQKLKEAQKHYESLTQPHAQTH